MLWNIISYEKNDLGEGPYWDERTGEIIWVDYDKKHIHFCKVAHGTERTLQMDEPCMVAIPTQSGRMIAAIDNRVAIIDKLYGKIITQVCPEPEMPANRLNDGKCDARGRLWIGTMDRSAAEGKGHLYRIDENLMVKRMASNFTIPNGMSWSSDGTAFFVVDSAKRQILRYAFEMESGEIKNPEILITTPVEMGLPDGMCIDNEENLWVAFWQGGCVTVFNSHSGQMVKSYKTPCMVPTSCCIGGVGGQTLFVTSSRKYDTVGNIEQFPQAGALFSMDLTVTALPPCLFNDKGI